MIAALALILAVVALAIAGVAIAIAATAVAAVSALDDVLPTTTTDAQESTP